jgi:hypothetical protein
MTMKAMRLKWMCQARKAVKHQARGDVGQGNGRDAEECERKAYRIDGIAGDLEYTCHPIEGSGRLTQGTGDVRPDPAFAQNAPGVDTCPALVAVKTGGHGIQGPQTKHGSYRGDTRDSNQITMSHEDGQEQAEIHLAGAGRRFAARDSAFLPCDQ